MKKLLAFIICLFSLTASAKLPQISAYDLKAKLLSNDSDFILVDVRTVSEYEEQHINGAILFPLQKFKTRLDQFVKAFGTKTIYFICRSGNRSSKATNILIEQGVKAINVTGGMKAWNKL